MPEGLDVALAQEEAQRESGTPHLRRALGQRDLVLLFVVAVLNLNTVPPVAAGGPVTAPRRLRPFFGTLLSACKNSAMSDIPLTIVAAVIPCSSL